MKGSIVEVSIVFIVYVWPSNNEIDSKLFVDIYLKFFVEFSPPINKLCDLISKSNIVFYVPCYIR